MKFPFNLIVKFILGRTIIWTFAENFCKILGLFLLKLKYFHFKGALCNNFMGL